MADIEKKYVDYAALQEYDRKIKRVINTDFSGATSSAGGVAGRVPAPGAGDQDKFLKGDGTWGGFTGYVSGVKGNAEIAYRGGDVNLTLENLGVYHGGETAWNTKTTAEKVKFDFCIITDD